MSVKTQFFGRLIDEETADMAFEYIKNNTEWVDGIYSRRSRRVSRKAYHVSMFGGNDIDDFILSLVIDCLNKTGIRDKYKLLGTYVNYYRDGNDFTPSHSHKGQIQLVISLGVNRELIVGSKTYNIGNGDVIVFGSSTHSVPADNTITESRISIATFMTE